MYTAFVISFFSGLLPVLFWLWFFDHEDKHPEPKRRVIKVFCAGMVVVLIVIPFEKLVVDYVSDTTSMIVLWAFIEEIAKFAAAYIFALRSRDNDEPIDAIMYLITAALGFAALENMLFLLNPLLEGNVQEAIITGNFRFIGATLLHITASSMIGVAMAFTFYADESRKRLYMAAGIIGAIALHTAFNLSIIGSDGNKAIYAFYTVWVALVVLLLSFEKVKQIKKPID
ncbi:MAG: PrsW family glutamic-type intramembrane protease [Patescibacteria group bacterium]